MSSIHELISATPASPTVLQDKPKDFYIQSIRYKLFVFNLSTTPNKYFGATFNPNAADPYPPLIANPGQMPQIPLLEMQNMTSTNKAALLSEYNTHLKIWQIQSTEFQLQEDAVKKIKEYLTQLLPDHWWPLLFPLGDPMAFVVATPRAIWAAVQHHFGHASKNFNQELRDATLEIATYTFTLENSDSFPQFFNMFKGQLDYINYLRQAPLSTSDAADHLMYALQRCPELSTNLLWQQRLLEYDNLHRAAGSRTLQSVRDLAQRGTEDILKLRTMTTFGYANAAIAAPASASLTPPAHAYAAAAAPASAAAAVAPAATVSPFPFFGAPSGVSINYSDPRVLKALLKLANVTAPASPPTVSASRSSPAVPKVFSKKYCFSCGTTTGPTMHFSQECPNNLRKPNHVDSCTFRNRHLYPGAAAPK